MEPKNIRLLLLSIFLSLPVMAFAHGEDAIYSFCVQAISIIVSLIFIAFFKAKAIITTILIVTYLLSVFAIGSYTNNIPFRQNVLAINLSVAFIPAIITCAVYFLLRFLKVGR